MLRNLPFLVLHLPGAVGKAEHHFKTAVRLADRIGALGVKAQACFDLGRLYRFQRKDNLAEPLIKESMALFDKLHELGNTIILVTHEDDSVMETDEDEERYIPPMRGHFYASVYFREEASLVSEAVARPVDVGSIVSCGVFDEELAHRHAVANGRRRKQSRRFAGTQLLDTEPERSLCTL